jgi:ribosome maturation factor RimP
MDIKEKLTQLAGESLLNPGQFIVEVIASSRNLSKITVIVDGDNGVNIDDCHRISKELSAKLDELDFGTDRYVLEVSTPGLDHPLKLKRQYQKNVGRGLKVHCLDKSVLQGKLVEVSDEAITLRQELKEGKKITDKDVVIKFEDVERAFVMVSFK